MIRTNGNHPDAQQIIENITQCVITTDLNGYITYWSAASERIFGYSREEILNCSLETIYPSASEAQFNSDLTTLREGNPVNGQWKSYTKEGNIIWIDVHAIPFMDHKGNPNGIIVSAYDIQDLKKLKNELERNKAQAEAIFETTVDGIITMEEDGSILSFNPAASQIFGYEEKEIRGQNIKILMSESFHKVHERFMNAYQENGEQQLTGYNKELMGKQKDGSRFPMELSISKVQWKSSCIFTVVVHDISERRRLETEILRISEKERRSLGQDLHDGLGQMLTGIGLISQHLAQKLAAVNQEASAEVMEIANLVKEADEYAKALAHGLVPEDIEEDGLQSALNRLSKQAEKFFKVNCSFHSECDIKIDNSMNALHLYRIAQEAISNAVKHGKAANIQIDLIAQKDVLNLFIIDDGIGFSKSKGSSNENGMGIHIMKYRSNIMSGHLEIVRTENHQTKVICSIPYEY